MNAIKKMVALLLALLMVVSFAGCGGGGNTTVTPTEADGRTVIYYAASYVNAQVQPAYKEMVESYNNGQGVTDGVYVQMRDNAGAISGLDSALRNNYQYDVLELHDDEFKTLAMQGGNYFVKLDDYLTEDVKAAMAWD